jgi:hypothetical protein
MEDVSLDEVKRRTRRPRKTQPLRDRIAAMVPGDAIFVSTYEEGEDEVEGAYRPGTISQVVGEISRTHETLRYSVRRDQTQPGFFVTCRNASDKPDRRKPSAS